jgi:YVTN family beta-propeller protein
MNHSNPIVMLSVFAALAGCGNGTSSGENAAQGAGSGGQGSGGLPAAGSGASGDMPQGKAYVGLFGDNAVAVVDLGAASVATTIPVSAPDGLVIKPDGTKVYVSSNNGTVVDVIDTATEAVTTNIEVGTQPAGLSITADGKYVVVSVQGDGQVAVIDTVTDVVVAKTPVGKAHNSVVSADGTLAFVASQVADAPAVDVVDIPSGMAGPSFALDASPRALTEVAGKLYATVAGSGDIQVLEATNGQKLSAITTAGSPHDIRPTLDGAFIATVSQTAGELELIDPEKASVMAHIATGKMPHWIGLSRDGAFAYVTNEGDNNLVVVDLAARAVKKTLSIGNAPRKLAVWP